MARNEALDQARAEVLSRLGLEAAEQGESVRLDFEDGIFATMEGSSDGHAMVLCACCELPEHLQSAIPTARTSRPRWPETA